MFSARRPIASEPPSATTPRSSGRRSTRWRRSAEVNGNVCDRDLARRDLALARARAARRSARGRRPTTCGRRASSRLRARPVHRSARRARAPPCARPTWSRRRAGGCGRRGAGSARRDRRCRSASGGPCRTGGSSSRSRRAARAWWSASRTRCRTCSERSRSRTRGWISVFMSPSSVAGAQRAANRRDGRRCEALSPDAGRALRALRGSAGSTTAPAGSADAVSVLPATHAGPVNWTTCEAPAARPVTADRRQRRRADAERDLERPGRGGADVAHRRRCR